MKILKYFFQALLIYLLFFIIKIIGLNLSRKLFSLVFVILGPLLKSKKVINSNLDKINNGNEKEKIIKNMWKNYGMTFAEYMFLHKFRKNNYHIKIKGQHILENIIKKNKPVIFISGHFANFELMSMELTKSEIDLATIYRPLNNIFLNPLMEFIRETYVCKNQIKKGLAGVKESINYLKKNYSIAMMVDQRVSEGESLSFFGDNAFTTTLPAQLSLKFDCDIVPIYICRKNNSNFEMEIYDPITTTKEQDIEKNKIEISLELNKIIEKMILKDPSQWIWTHNRWK